MGILGALGSNPSSLPLGQPVAPPVAAPAPAGAPMPSWVSGPTPEDIKAREAEMRRIRLAGLSQILGSLAVGQAPDVSASAKALAEMRERGQATLGDRSSGQQVWQTAQLLGLSPDQMRVLASMPQEAATQVIMGLAGARFEPPKVREPIQVGNDLVVRRPDGTYEKVYSAQPDPLTAIAKLNADLAAGRITPEQHSAAVESTLSKNGLSIEVGPDGNVRVVQGDIGKDPTDVSDPTTPASMLQTIDGLLKDPGLDMAVGIGRIASNVPGTAAARASARIDQLEGQAFMTVIGNLRGMGALSDTEGQRALAAANRLNRDLSPNDYREALTELKGLLEMGLARQEVMSRGRAVQNRYDLMSDEDLLKIIQGTQ